MSIHSTLGSRGGPTRGRTWPASVTIAGEVNRPGVYGIAGHGDSLKQLIARAGGLTGSAAGVDLTAMTRNQAGLSTREVPHILSNERVPLDIEALLKTDTGDPGLQDGDPL